MGSSYAVCINDRFNKSLKFIDAQVFSLTSSLGAGDYYVQRQQGQVITLIRHNLKTKDLISKAPAKRSQHANATYRNIVGRNMLRAFGHPVAMCCDVLGVVGSSLKMAKYEPTTPNTSQHAATGWLNAHNMLRPTMLRYVALACCDQCCDRLPRALPQNTNNEKNKTVTQKQMKVARKPKKKPSTFQGTLLIKTLLCSQSSTVIVENSPMGLPRALHEGLLPEQNSRVQNPASYSQTFMS